MVLAHLFAASGILWGTVTDIRTREVPDWVNYSLIAAGLFLGVLSALAAWSWSPLLSSLAGLAVGWVLGAAMYYTGQWGGGDAKMIMGLGALFGMPVSAAGWSSLPFLLLFLLATIFMGAAYGLVWMFALFVRHRRAVRARLEQRLHEPRMVRVRLLVMGATVLLALLALLLPWQLRLLLWVLAAVLFVTWWLSLVVKAVEETCFVKERKVSALVEGDWVVGAVMHKGKVLVPEGNPGLTKEQMALLRKHKVRSVTVKEGIPFVPSFLLAYLVALAFWRLDLPLLFWL